MARFILDCEDEEIDKEALAAALSDEANSDTALSAEIVFTDGAAMQKLNAEARGVDAVTDVLSFPNLDEIKNREIKWEDFPFDRDEAGNLFLGSIIICRERAAEQATEFGHSLKREYYYLAVHGMCHLLGYDHVNEDEKREMREKEEKILQKLGVTRE